ncbi:MAG: Sulfite reductase flavoprotein alpha-component [Myxococcaceae bacterium]|nr:Sulfite reductase flavoprotein alpha-component [Myxococcaceae bacterium]
MGSSPEHPQWVGHGARARRHDPTLAREHDSAGPPASERSCPRAASELALRRLEHTNLRAGHENAGFLSARSGFLPSVAPLTRLDAQFAPWDELAHDLPMLYRTLGLRRRVEQLPVLDASADNLAAPQVLRACALLAIASHGYWYVDSRPPADLPASLRMPWAELRKRLGRSQEVISYIDLIVYNWKVRDPTAKDLLAVENLDLLFPTVGNQEERVFYLTQLEILDRTSPVVRLIAAAQGAVVREDEEELEAALLGIVDCLTRVVASSLPKINPNPYSKSHVDPVVWAKTVAPFAVPLHPGDQGPSGTSSPLFNALDLFFGRKDYASFLGREIKQLRGSYPRAWQVFLGSLTEVSVARFIEQRGSRTLRSAFREAFELYAGETGFLGRHRMKVYGYLELAFKVGRSVTIGGFGGVFTDRTWDVVDRELSKSQCERTYGHAPLAHRARVLPSDAAGEDRGSGIRHVTLDVSRAGVRYRGGDRCLILPENDPELVERTLRSLGAHGNERVALTPEWIAYARDRAELFGHTQVSARELLRYGAIRPVSPRLAEALHALTQSPFLLDAIERGCTERWELWELLELLEARGVKPRELWQTAGVEVCESLSRLIPPQRFRVYSVSSAPASPLRRGENSLQLTVGQLSYRAADAPSACPVHEPPEPSFGCPMHHARPAGAESAQPDPGCAAALRYGTGSSFLSRALAQSHEVPFRIQHPDLFRLPDDPDIPIVMFAGGSGVAPFRAFLQERQRTSRKTSHLFLSLRSPHDFHYADDFAATVASGALALEVAFTRVGARVVLGEHGRLSLREGPVQRLPELMLQAGTCERLWQLALPKEEGGSGAVFYVCGRGGFADAVRGTLKQIFRQRGGPATSAERASQRLYQMVADRRLLQEVHADAQPLDEAPRWIELSEVARHNDAQHGYWVVIDRVVYDLTEFIELHPGGRRVVQAYAGMDASHGFARAHHGRADVDAMRESYRIGMVRTPVFDDHAVQVEAPSGLLTVDCAAAYRAFVKALSLVVEMQNALVADQSLQSSDTGAQALGERGSYKLLRAVETHRRFLSNYFAVLVTTVLPELWCVGQGLFFADDAPAWMSSFLRTQRASDQAEHTEALALEAFEQFERLCEDGVILRLVETFEARDLWFLRALKDTLLVALREFERHAVDVRERGALRIRRACLGMAGVVRQYYRRSMQEGLEVVRCGGQLGTLAPSASCAGTVSRRLHTGTHWILEDDPDQRTAVLRRTPIAAGSLLELSQENEHVLRCLQPVHKQYGLVVDTRQARMRNDRGFEDAMAKLRRELTSHFERTAVLLESSVGELQVTRLERDERRDVIATRSESTAFKFAQGGA